LRQTVENVKHAIEAEEKQFLGVVDRGIQKFRQMVEHARAKGQKTLSGDEAFDLHQTDGFLIELTEGLAQAEGLSVDRDRYNARMEEHRKRSGSGAFADSVMSEGPIDALRKQGGTKFLGYETTSADAKIVGIIADKQLVPTYNRTGQPIGIVLDKTPFYGESGGQVGDTGRLVLDGGVFTVQDTQKNGDLFVHIGELQSGSLKVGSTVKAEVDVSRREGIRRAHSATHLLHHALRKYLGENATQRGSKVEADQLRFDFAHPKAVTDDELLHIEDEINARIAEGAPVNIAVMPLAEAKQLGAMALFGEKYPDNVRVVSMGDFSREFCGGTHLSNTGQVGLCRIVKEELIAAGIRRVTCLTGPKALQRIRETEGLVKQVAGLLKAQPDELPRKVQMLQDELRQTKQELSKYTAQSLAATAKKLVAEAEVVNGTTVVVQAVDCPRESLKEFVDCIREQAPSVAVLLGLVTEGKVALIAGVSKDLIAKKISASDAVKAAAKVAGGGGGGRPDLAEAGGKLPDKLPEALAAGAEFFRGKLLA
jgi:alanyl-tRNA synthetase